MDSRRSVIAAAIRRGVREVHDELDRHIGFGVPPGEVRRLKMKYPLDGALGDDVMRLLELPQHLGRTGESVADVLGESPAA